MTDLEVIEAVSQEPVRVKLSAGEFSVHPLTIKRSAKLTLMLQGMQGDPTKLKDVDSPEFYQTVIDMLGSIGDNSMVVLTRLTGDEGFSKLEDISLLDISTVCIAAAKANKANVILANFTQATDILNGQAAPK